MKQKIGFIGVGAMGVGMAANLSKAGFPVCFHARATGRGEAAAIRLVEAGATRAASLPELAAQVDVVILCLPDSPTVESLLGSGAEFSKALRSGMTVLDTSTSHPESTIALARELSARDVVLLDAPLTGSKTQAEAGALSVLGAGDAVRFEQLRPVMQGFARNVFYLGGTGAGHTAKLLNNFFGQMALAGLCEAFPLLARYGVSPQEFFAAISASGGNSALFQGAFPRFLKRDFTVYFAQALAKKDVSYFNDLLARSGLPAMMACHLLGVHIEASAAGFGEKDATALLEFYEGKATVPAA